MKAFDVPGMAVAIVKDGKILVAKGYGVRKLGDPTPVDEFTLFGIGSNTKAFTTAALATLIDEGKLSWDDPVYQRLPGFVMYDPYVSHEMTIRDLLTHRSGMGLGEGDLLFWPHSTYSRDEIIYKLRFMKPAALHDCGTNHPRRHRHFVGRVYSPAHFYAARHDAFHGDQQDFQTR
jgi:CubicO group peptidase (beta-lactamase class C family)